MVGCRVLAALGAVCVVAAAFDCRALSCGNYPDSLKRADNVYIIAPRQVLSRGKPLDPYSRIGGMPATYDLVRFEVLETLRGPRLAELDLYCASGCGDDTGRTMSVLAVAKRRADGQPNVLIGCNSGPADDAADANTRQALDDVRHGVNEHPQPDRDR